MKWKVGNLDDFNWSGSRLKEMKNKKDHPLKKDGDIPIHLKSHEKQILFTWNYAK